MNYPLFRTSLLAIVAIASLCAGYAQAPSNKATVAGKFLGNGKDANLQHLLVQTREPFSGKAAVQLIFTEKDPATSKKPDFDARFSKLGNALLVSTFKDGSIFSCNTVHNAHERLSFSTIGELEIKDFKVTDTHISGVLTTGRERDAFGQKWSVDITFSAPLPKGAFAAASEPPAAPEKGDNEKPAAPATPAVPAGPKIPVAKLPLPAGALDVEYQGVTEFITFRSNAAVAAVTKDYAAKLKEAGWKDAVGSLNGKNSILKRKLNTAELTIMIQAAPKGTTVKVFTKGLDWSEVPASAPAKPAKVPSADDIEAEANRQLQDALKNVPKL